MLKEFISAESQEVQQAFEVYVKGVDKVDLLRKLIPENVLRAVTMLRFDIHSYHLRKR